MKYWQTGPERRIEPMSMFEAYITNTALYPMMGIEVGTTVYFPTTTQEVQSALAKIGIDGKRYSEVFITSFDSDVLGLYDYLDEYENIDELNELGHALLEVRDKGGLETFEAALVLGKHTGSVKDLINLTQNLDLYRFTRIFLMMKGWVICTPTSWGPSTYRSTFKTISTMRHTGGMCVSTRAVYSPPADMWRRTRWASRSITTGRRTYRRNTGYLPIPKRPNPSIPFSAHSNGFKRPRPLRKRTRRGLPMRNGKTSGQHGPKHEGGAYHQLLPHQ